MRTTSLPTIADLIFADLRRFLTKITDFSVYRLLCSALSKLKVFKPVRLNYLIIGSNLVLMHDAFLRY